MKETKDLLCVSCGERGFKPITVAGINKYECINCGAQVTTMAELIQDASKEQSATIEA